ncbi:dihydroorotate dehydrogenase (quinone), mitochondrial [Cotesia glomerata]|uniref:dihydroorotate dehydrogenase (quinone), mitochondrial n=1 Tax=Cotesia glomerata TaxID=32391 RepID=UPI001D03308E|nr:dihydroorotate dehydrogenase (quinone), mitochondrial [Cotesia glomerata]XP_044599246.1 dihydroorotate dehydrogenase (quinone), mitochondrial [Cotesia glomerata]
MATRLSERKKIHSLLKVTFSSATVFAGTCMYQGNEKFYNQVLMPLVKLVDPEIAHNLAVTAAKWGFISEPKTPDSSALNQKVFGLKFSNPVGMAAGFDKQGEAIKGLTKMGFGFVEIGSVTPNPQPGNPKPRVFRLIEDKAIINRYGFNSEGHEAVYQRLLDLRSDSSFTGIIGVNLGKNKTSTDPVADYVEGVKKFSDVADYLVINVSSPNTEGLRDLQGKEHLEKLLSSINSIRQSMKSNPPLLLKLAPDLTNNQRQDVADVIQKSKCKVDGLILSNTTISRRDLSSEHKNETGGLSGAPLTDLSTDLIADMYKRTNGKIPIIGVGGIFSGKDAFDKIKAGASLIQIYTSYAYHGPPIVQKIKKELNDLIVLNRYSSITDAVGKNVK